MEVVKNEVEETMNVEEATKDVVTQDMVDKVKSELEEVKTENKKKVYSLEVKTEHNKAELLEYLDNDVIWENTQAYGISKVYDALAKEDIKDGKVYLGGLEVEALAFYLSKAKGQGKLSAERWVRMNDAIAVAYELRARDNQKINNLDMKLNHLMSALEQGIAVDTGSTDDGEEDIVG